MAGRSTELSRTFFSCKASHLHESKFATAHLQSLFDHRLSGEPHSSTITPFPLVPALRRRKNFVGEGEQICGSAIEAQGQKIAGLPQRDREVSVSLDGMSIRYGLYYSMHTRRIIGIAEDREDLNVVRRARHDTLQQQLGGQQVEDDTVDVKGAKHYLVFYATGMGAAHFQIACARYGLAAVNTKCLLEFTSRVLGALFLQGGMHAISLTYDAAKENTCASIHT